MADARPLPFPLSLRVVGGGGINASAPLGPMHDTPNIDPLCTDVGVLVKWVFRLSRHERRAVASLVHQLVRRREGGEHG